LSKKDLLLRVLVIFLGPEPPGFDDSDSDSDDNVVSHGNLKVVQPYSATLSSIVPDDLASENGSTGIYKTSQSREDENSIKLRVIGAGSCSDESDNDAAKRMEETERKFSNIEEKKQK
jgi:hypothetical protein